MKKRYFFILTLLLSTFTFAQPANDDCTNATSITVSNTSTNYTFDINTAVLNNETICSSTEDFADVWFEFTMPYDGNVFVNGFLSWNNFALYTTCGGAEIDCGESSNLFANLSSGTTYFLQVYRPTATASNANYQSFDIQSFPAATNDDCATSENITVSTSASTIDFEIGGATINNEIGCSGDASNYVDIWYDFTMPVNGNLFVNGTLSWNNFGLYDACGGTLIQCDYTNSYFNELTAGTTYKLRLFRTEALADNAYTSFTIQAFESVSNDDCASAENISVTTTESTVNFEIGGATINNEEGCPGTTEDYLDIWYHFTMPVNGNLYVSGSLSWNNFGLYDACNSTLIQCGNTNELFTDLTAGNDYKLRVFRTITNAHQSNYKSFTVQAFENVSNDDCASAENINVTTTESTIDFEIGGATINNETGCTATTDDYADIWYAFTMPVNGNLYVNGTLSWNNFGLYDACNGTLIQCGNTNELFTDLTAASNYKLRVFRTVELADNSNYKSFNIQAFEIINNDDCASAENITVTNTPTTVNFGIAGATINNEIGCSGTSAEDYADVWYAFTMPIDGYIVIDGTLSWNNFALYDTCNGNELGCFSNEGTIAGLTNGTTYKLRVFRTLALANNDSYKSFTIHSTETLSSNNTSLENSIGVYPNPADTMLQITNTENHTIKSVTLFNILGKSVLSTTSKTIDISTYPTGIYLIKITTEKGAVTKKIVIQ